MTDFLFNETNLSLLSTMDTMKEYALNHSNLMIYAADSLCNDLKIGYDFKEFRIADAMKDHYRVFNFTIQSYFNVVIANNPDLCLKQSPMQLLIHSPMTSERVSRKTIPCPFERSFFEIRTQKDSKTTDGIESYLIHFFCFFLFVFVFFFAFFVCPFCVSISRN